MSKFFLDPRDKYFDSASSISFKSFTQSTSESRVSQGLLRLNNIFWEKSKKQAFFISWKSFTQGSLYKLWKEVFKDHPNMQDFDTVLKILHKRKTKVDELWGMLKTEEIKHLELLETNKNLQARIDNLQTQVKVYTNQAVQVNFLQDSALRKTHDELAKLSKTLKIKEKQLESFENILTQKFDQLILREKNLHQKELSGLLFNDITLMKTLKSELFEFRSKIFPNYVETDFWIQVAESVQVTPGQVKKLQDYEEELFNKFEQTEKMFEKLREEAGWIENCKCELLEREANLLLRPDESVTEVVEYSQDSPVRIKFERKNKNTEDWPLAIINDRIDCDSIEYLKLGLQELRDMQKKSEKDESLFEEILSAVIRFSEKLIEKEQEFSKLSSAKNEYLEQAKNELLYMKQMLSIENDLNQTSISAENEQVIRKVTDIETSYLLQLQETIVEKHSCQIEKMIFEVEREEFEVRQAQLEHEIKEYERLNKELAVKNQDIEKRVFEFKTILQLMGNVTVGNIDIFKQELKKILFDHDKNPEVAKSLKLVMSLYLWLNLSFSQSQGKDLLRVKITFYLLRVRVLMLKKGFALAPVYFSTPQDCMWLEVFWLRARHNYFYDIYLNPEIISFTKHWFFKFISKKLQFAFDIMEKSHYRTLSHSFYNLRAKGIKSDQLKTQRLYSQLLKVEDKSCLQIKKEINTRGLNTILPLFKKFDKIWALNKKVFLLKWKNYSEKRENDYYRRTVFEIYSSMSELMIKEYKFKEECRVNQNILKGKISEGSRLLDKILL
jgi:hypothetical protein